MNKSFVLFFYRRLFSLKSFLIILFQKFNSNPFLTRELFVNTIPENSKVLEIGPFTIPSIKGPRVDYFDVLSKDQLIERAKKHKYPYDECPDIKFVSPTGNLSIVNEKYDYVISSHCIEHQPDLIKHLIDVNNILVDNGKYCLVIPDKRYCLDTFLSVSVIQEVLSAHAEKRKVHTLRSLIEHRAFITHNKAWLHWIGKHGKIYNNTERIKAAYNEYFESNGKYLDVHAWQFTPTSFEKIILSLYQLNLITFKIDKLYPTKPGELEFYAILKK
jgi:hypothetical protein